VEQIDRGNENEVLRSSKEGWGNGREEGNGEADKLQFYTLEGAWGSVLVKEEGAV